MVKLTDEQKNDQIVKSLLESGFSEDLIADWIASGAIELSKSVDDDDDDDDDDDEDPDNPAGDGGHDGDGNGEGDGDGKEKKVEKGCNGKKKSEDHDDLAKSLSVELMKPLDQKIHEEVDASSQEILKSLPSAIEEALRPFTEKIEKSLDGFRKTIELFGRQAPSFKSAGVSLPYLEKSVGVQKDADDKTILSVSRNREVVRAIITKSIDEEKDEAIKKSLVDNTTAYILDPVEGAIGESAARYFYEKKNIRLVD